jgi:molybdenum cofactor biosynthesis enzyme MoaA
LSEDLAFEVLHQFAYWSIYKDYPSPFEKIIEALFRLDCARCNRVRLSADGWLRPCLLNETGQIDLKTALRSGVDLAERSLICRLGSAKQNPTSINHEIKAIAACN